MRLIPSQVLLNAVFPVTLLWSAFSSRIPFYPVVAYRVVHELVPVRPVDLDPVPCITADLVLGFTLFPSLPSVSRIPSWSFHRAVLLNTVLLDEPLRDVIPFSVLWFATLLTRTLFQFEFVRLIPERPL